MYFNVVSPSHGCLASCVFPGILIPGVGDVFLNLLAVLAIHGQDFFQIPIEDHPTRKLELGRFRVAIRGQIAVCQVVLETATNRPPIFIERGHRHQVRQIDLFDELFGMIQQLFHMSQTFSIDGIRLIQIDRARRPSNQIIGMRVLAAENGMNLDDFFLPLQSLQVMGDVR